MQQRRLGNNGPEVSAIGYGWAVKIAQGCPNIRGIQVYETMSM